MRVRNLVAKYAVASVVTCLGGAEVWGHGSAASPESRVHRVFASNPENPSFALAEQAIATDGTQSYYTWMELSRNIPAAVNAGLPAGFDYSPWVPDGQLASGGRVAPDSAEYPRTYAGLDQVSGDWPTSPAQAGELLAIDFDAPTPHEPSVWDVWLTTADWTPAQPLNWAQMEFLGRPAATLTGNHYYFDVMIPSDRVGHHVLWIAWQRDDPVGEVFFSASDLMIAPAEGNLDGDFNNDGIVDAADYTTWRDRLGAPFSQDDYNTWRSNFGATLDGGAASTPAPEPGVGVWLVLACVIGLRCAARAI